MTVLRQIEVTKENLEKWADDCYAGSSQSYEKFNRRASTRLTKSEREEIAQFLAMQPTATLEETARYFSKLFIFTDFYDNFIFNCIMNGDKMAEVGLKKIV